MEIISRKDALERGLKRFFTGKPCQKGHVAERFVANFDCIECKNAYIKEYNAANKDRVQANRSAYREANKERIAKVTKDYREANKERISSQRNNYIASNKARRASMNAKRRARELRATVGWGDDLTSFVAEQAYDLAKRREAATGFGWQVDHMIPLQARTACGLHVWNNLQVIPARLNNSKLNKLILTEPFEWLQHI